MTDTQTVDAGSQEAPATETQQAATQDQTQGADYWKGEAHSAFEKRDNWKAKAKTAEARIKELEGALADTEGNLAEQLKTALTERDSIAEQFSAHKATVRDEKIIAALTRGAPEKSHKALTMLYRSNASQLDNGEAKPEDVAQLAREFLGEVAPTLFENPAAPRAGFVPDEKAAKLNPTEARERARADRRKRFPGSSGVTL